MKIKVIFEKEKSHRTVEVRREQTIESLLKEMKVNPQTVIVVKNGEVVTEQEILSDGDELKVLSVKLGG